MKLILFIALLLPFAWGCKKKTTSSNDNSSSYANSFTCEVNGQSWIAQTPDNPNGPVAVSANYNAEYDQLDIFATRKNQNAYPTIYERIFLRIQHPSENSVMIVGNGNLYGFSNYLQSSCGLYYYDSLYPADCTVTSLDIENHKVEGTFQIQLRNKDCADSVMIITNGHFSTYFQ